MNHIQELEKQIEKLTNELNHEKKLIMERQKCKHVFTDLQGNVLKIEQSADGKSLTLYTSNNYLHFDSDSVDKIQNYLNKSLNLMK